MIRDFFLFAGQKGSKRAVLVPHPQHANTPSHSLEAPRCSTTKAIVLAMFGTTVESRPCRTWLAIHAAVQTAYPKTPVKIAFTSNQIRAQMAQAGG